MKQISLFITKDQYDGLKKYNETTGSSYGSLIRKLLSDYLTKEGD